MPPVSRRTLLAVSGSLLMQMSEVRAQTYPARPVQIIVPFPAGNTSDILARIIAEQVRALTGVTMVVENRAGASGAIGVRAVASAPPDGYTLMITTQSPLVVSPPLTRDLPYDPIRDVVPIALFARTRFILVTSPDFPANSVAEAVAVLRAAQPGHYSAANAGSGTLSQLAMELFASSLGTRFVAVPYRGSSAALVDLSAGRVQLMIDGLASAVPQARGGLAKAIAVIAPQRSPLVPEVPSIAEGGIPELAGLDAPSWTGLLGPAGTPPEVTTWWLNILRRIMADPAMITRLKEQYLEAVTPPEPSAFAGEIAADLARWTKVVRDARLDQQP